VTLGQAIDEGERLPPAMLEKRITAHNLMLADLEGGRCRTAVDD
jgi:hypothetical protein